MVAGQSKDEMLYNEVQNGNIEAVRALHHSGAGLEWMDKEGRTPLILACTRGDSLEMILALLNLGANLNAYRHGSQCGTPLHHAAKQGHYEIVALLLHHGAYPLVPNDDCEAPLQMARARGHVTVVRLIEGRISLFCGWILVYSSRCCLEELATEWLPKRIWAVVLPSASNNPRKPPRFELVIYPKPKVTQPRTIIFLSEVTIEKPKFSRRDPKLVLFDKRKRTRYTFLSETEGDKNQLQRLYEACKGTHQRHISSTASEHQPLPEDVQLATAIDASVQSWAQEIITFPGTPQQGSLTSDFNDWGSMSNNGGNGWSPPERAEMPINSDKRNEWGVNETRPGSKNIADDQTTDSVSGPSLPENAPSAPLLPEEYMSGSDHSAQLSTSSNKSQGNTFGACVICWYAQAEAVCVPCGHLAGCMACLNDIKGKKSGCPVCRARIKQVVKVYAVR